MIELTGKEKQKGVDMANEDKAHGSITQDEENTNNETILKQRVDKKELE